MLSFPLLPDLLALARLARLTRLLRPARLRVALGRPGLLYVALVNVFLIPAGRSGNRTG